MVYMEGTRLSRVVMGMASPFGGTIPSRTRVARHPRACYRPATTVTRALESIAPSVGCLLLAMGPIANFNAIPAS